MRRREEGEDEEVTAEQYCEATDDPDPDSFVPQCQRLPKGHTVATAHAEQVLLDRVRALLDAHYDEVFLSAWHDKYKVQEVQEQEPGAALSKARQPPRRRGAHRIDSKVLEARTSQRYEEFTLPDIFKTMFRHPKDETDWNKIEEFGKLVVDMADGVVEERVSDEKD